MYLAQRRPERGTEYLFVPTFGISTCNKFGPAPPIEATRLRLDNEKSRLHLINGDHVATKGFDFLASKAAGFQPVAEEVFGV
jgi:hypothetical protein